MDHSCVLPRPVWTCGEGRKWYSLLSTGSCCVFAQVLSPLNMHSRFSTLLWLEELHAEREMKEFTINGALLKKGAGYLHLEVPGLAEGRPSLSIGKSVLGVLHFC